MSNSNHKSIFPQSVRPTEHTGYSAVAADTLPSPVSSLGTSSPPAHADCMIYKSLEIKSMTDFRELLHFISALSPNQYAGRVQLY